MTKFMIEELKEMKLAILPGDIMENLATLPDESVQCVVTSPPYWGLRDYKIPPTVWGGHALCIHAWGKEAFSTLGRTQGATGCRAKRKFTLHTEASKGAWCQICGAWRGCLGLEPTPQHFVDNLVLVFREIRRVLKKNGTIWVNLGDCYAGSGKGPSKTFNHDNDNSVGVSKPYSGGGFKPKDLMMMPARVAIALQADGWYLRQDIIWEKDNPMPESVNDRPTTAHEHLFLLAKSKKYYYDAEAIKIKVTGGAHSRGDGMNPKAMANQREDGIKQNESYSRAMSGTLESEMKNNRSVWHISTQACPGAHFATYPEKLVEPCVLAGSKPGDIVLDPFGGSGTTARVAIGLGRSAILIEINPEYVKLCQERCTVTMGFKF